MWNVHSKMAAYLVGIQFAYIVVIPKPLSLPFAGEKEADWLLSKGI